MLTYIYSHVFVVICIPLILLKNITTKNCFDRYPYCPQKIYQFNYLMEFENYYVAYNCCVCVCLPRPLSLKVNLILLSAAPPFALNLAYLSPPKQPSTNPSSLPIALFSSPLHLLPSPTLPHPSSPAVLC